MCDICYGQGCQRIFNQMENLPYGTNFCPVISEKVHFLCLSVIFIWIWPEILWVLTKLLNCQWPCDAEVTVTRFVADRMGSNPGLVLLFYFFFELEFYVVFRNNAQTQTCLIHVIVFLYKYQVLLLLMGIFWFSSQCYQDRDLYLFNVERKSPLKVATPGICPENTVVIEK